VCARTQAKERERETSLKVLQENRQ